MKRRSWILTGWLMLSLASHVHAHLRNYLDTYNYSTLEKGRYEFEFFNDYHDPDNGEGYWLNQSEVEFGITDRYTMGLYGVFQEGLGFTAFKIENRYRLLEPGEWIVDPALYFEIKDANDHKDEDELEGKIILSKDIGKVNVTFNGILEYEREIEPNGDTEWEMEAAMSLGACYATGHRITPGIELYSAENETRLVPGLYVDLAKDIRLNVGVGIGLEENAEDAIFKSILEFEF